MKKIILLTILLFQLTFAFGQICVESETMYNSGGLNVSYCTTSQGNEGNCSKYTVSISIRNNGSDKISIAGSSIFIGGNCKETSYSNSYGEIRFAFPAGGLGFVTELSPNYNMTKSYVAYTNNNNPPVVKWYITPNYMSVKKETTKSQNTNTTSSNQNTESQTYQNIQEAITKFNSLINQAANADQQVATRIQTDVQNALKSDRNTESFKLIMVNNGIRDLENLIARKSNNSTNQTNTSNQQAKIEQERQRIEKEKQAEEERIRKEQEAKKAQFDDAIQNGDNAFGNKEYDNAMNYYSQAKNYAQNDSERTIADSKYNKAYEAKRTAAREERLEKQKERDQKEDLAYTAAATGMLGAMALVNDRYTHKVSSGKLQFGLGYDQTPMITNQNNSYAPLASFADKASYPTLFMALRLEFLNNKPVNLNVRGLYSIGIQAFDTGVSGGHVVTGFDGGIQFWYKSHTKFKLFADAGLLTRVGERIKDQDAVNGGTTATDDVREGKYNYKIFRYGGGPMLHLRNDGRETWVKTGIFFEKISFAEDVKPTMSFTLSANIESEIIFEFTFSKNYPVAGTINYPTTFTFENQNYFSIKLIRQGNLW